MANQILSEACDTVPIFEAENSVEPPMVRWGSKTDRVNLCEVGGVSLPLMVLKQRTNNIADISWRLISRCYQH